MKKNIIILTAITLFALNGKGQKHNYQDLNIRCVYNTIQGRLYGQYVSYYSNGIKKAEGSFANNCRIGIWTVWDSTGKIRMQREYENFLTYKRIIPPTPKDKPIELLNTPKYSLLYNNDGYIDCFNVKERMVIWSQRIWRFIEPNDNPLLFDNNKLFDIIDRNIKTKNFVVYKDEEFMKPFIPVNYNSSAFNMIGYKVKEDAFLDTERLLLESIIIGICPVVVNIENKDTMDLFWIYFPDFRKVLAQEKTLQFYTPSYIKSFDDVFFFRYFYAQIYKESNMYDRPIAKYKSKEDIAKEAERIEMNILDTEHDFWISLTKK